MIRTQVEGSLLLVREQCCLGVDSVAVLLEIWYLLQLSLRISRMLYCGGRGATIFHSGRRLRTDHLIDGGIGVYRAAGG
jgi:hypothetical protein